MKNNVVLSFVITLVVVIAALLSSLAILGALSWDEVTGNIAKVLGIAAIVVLASFLISFVTNRD